MTWSYKDHFYFLKGFKWAGRGQDVGTASEDQGDLTLFLCLGPWTLSFGSSGKKA